MLLIAPLGHRGAPRTIYAARNAANKYGLSSLCTGNGLGRSSNIMAGHGAGLTIGLAVRYIPSGNRCVVLERGNYRSGGILTEYHGVLTDHASDLLSHIALRLVNFFEP